MNKKELINYLQTVKFRRKSGYVYLTKKDAIAMVNEITSYSMNYDIKIRKEIVYMGHNFYVRFGYDGISWNFQLNNQYR